MSNWAKMQAMLKSAPSSSAPSSSSFSGSSKPKKRPRPQEHESSDGTSRSYATLAGRGGSAGGNSSASGAGKPQPFVPAPNAPALLEPGMQHYEEVMQRCFKGFVKQPADALPPGLDRRVIQALERLKEARLFHHDVVTNGGIRLGATVVRRILVGEPGITYKYLGLRTFAHPWRGEGARKELAPMLELNELMTTSTRKLLAKGHGVGHAGSCAYNLSLVNLLEPSDARGGALRNRAGEKLGTGSLAVSWHADSSVQPASSIAVVNLTLPYHKKSSSQQMPWRIAMKCVGEGHEPDKPSGGVGSSGVRKAGTPAVAVPLSASETYYLLGEFNDHHHHAVLAGDAPRYSSTHRVGVVASDTWKYISDRCAEALPAGPAGAPPSFTQGAVLRAAQLRLVEEVHSEVEFEWLRPWGVQGRTHAETHKGYWQPRLERLERTWRQFEARTAAHLAFLVAASTAPPEQAAKQLPEGVRCFDVLLGLLTKREGMATDAKQQGRAGWRARAASREYKGLPQGSQPFPFPSPLPAGMTLAEVDERAASDSMLANLAMPDEALATSIGTLTRARAAFVKSAACQPSNGYGSLPAKKKQHR